jgi:hypothetical protein
MVQVMTDLQAAIDHIPKSEHAPEAKSLFEAMQPSNRRQQCGRAGWVRFCPQSWPNWG